MVQEPTLEGQSKTEIDEGGEGASSRSSDKPAPQPTSVEKQLAIEAALNSLDRTARPPLPLEAREDIAALCSASCVMFANGISLANRVSYLTVCYDLYWPPGIAMLLPIFLEHPENLLGSAVLHDRLLSVDEWLSRCQILCRPSRPMQVRLRLSGRPDGGGFLNHPTMNPSARRKGFTSLTALFSDWDGCWRSQAGRIAAELEKGRPYSIARVFSALRPLTHEKPQRHRAADYSSVRLCRSLILAIAAAESGQESRRDLHQDSAEDSELLKGMGEGCRDGCRAWGCGDFEAAVELRNQVRECAEFPRFNFLDLSCLICLRKKDGSSL